MTRIQLGELDGEGDIIYLSAVAAMEMVVCFDYRIKTHLSRTRVETSNDSLGYHEFQVAIHGSKADSREPLLDPQVYLIGAGMIPAETEFFQKHGPLFRFSQNN
jgi:hypothetical protein